METDYQVVTKHDPQALAYCAYCNLHTTLDNYDTDTQMCHQCLEKMRLEIDNANAEAQK